MATTQGTPVTSASAARKRQRSTRLTVALALLVLAAAVVLGGVLSGSWLILVLAAVGAVVLGAAATRITHTELATARREAARDRAAQAQDYRRLSEERGAEHAAYVEHMAGRIAERETTLAELQEALGTAQRQGADMTRKMNAEARRAELAERDVERVQGRVDDAESRAAQAIVLVAELEQEIDVLRSELDAMTLAWQSAEASSRKRA